MAINSSLYCNRAAARIKLAKFSEAIEDCNSAILYNKDYYKAYVRRADCYMKLDRFQDALNDYKTANKIEETPEVTKKVREAEVELKKSKRKDHYKILGLSRSANDKEIRKAYKKGVMVRKSFFFLLSLALFLCKLFFRNFFVDENLLVFRSGTPIGTLQRRRRRQKCSSS